MYAGILSLYVAAVVAILASTSVQAAEDVCALLPAKMYVRDATQTNFPAGFLPCVGADKTLNPRCAKCKCRQLQSVKQGGKPMSWGLCIENAASCASPQAPGRTQCGGEKTTKAYRARGGGGVPIPPRKDAVKTTTPSANEGKVATGANHAFEPGHVNAQNPMESGGNVTTPGDTLEQNALDASAGLGGGEEKKKKTGVMFVAACVVAAGAGIAVFAIVRKKDKSLGTPKQNYKDTDTSKARAKSVAARQSRAGSSYNQGATAGGVDPYAVNHHQQELHDQPPRKHSSRHHHDHDHGGSGSDRRDSTSTSDEEDDFAPFDNGDGKAESFASYSIPDDRASHFSEIDLQTNMSMGYGLGHTDDDDEYYHNDARLSIHSSDDEEEVDLRDSTNSMLYSSASALAYFEGDGSPRKSIEF